VWVTDALSAAPDDAQRVRVLDSLFLQLFSRRSIEIPPKLAAALSVVWSGGCFGSMPELIARTGYSERTLRRRFRTATGLSPRQYHVVLRAERALSALYYRPELGLDDVAHYAGYSDQSHLIHHMRRLTGMTPGALRGEPCAGVAPLRDFFRPASGRTIQYNSA
jgi:AraC-like DNA-binding protein